MEEGFQLINIQWWGTVNNCHINWSLVLCFDCADAVHGATVPVVTSVTPPPLPTTRRPVPTSPRPLKPCRGECVGGLFALFCDDVDSEAHCPDDGSCCITNSPPAYPSRYPTTTKLTTPTTTTTTTTTTTRWVEERYSSKWSSNENSFGSNSNEFNWWLEEIV